MPKSGRTAIKAGGGDEQVTLCLRRGRGDMDVIAYSGRLGSESTMETQGL